MRRRPFKLCHFRYRRFQMSPYLFNANDASCWFAWWPAEGQREMVRKYHGIFLSFKMKVLKHDEVCTGELPLKWSAKYSVANTQCQVPSVQCPVPIGKCHVPRGYCPLSNAPWPLRNVRTAQCRVRPLSKAHFFLCPSSQCSIAQCQCPVDKFWIRLTGGKTSASKRRLCRLLYAYFVVFFLFSNWKNIPMFMYLFNGNKACAGLVGPYLQADAGYPWPVTRGAALIQLQVRYITRYFNMLYNYILNLWLLNGECTIIL